MSIHKKYWKNGNIRYLKEGRCNREKHYYYDSHERLRCVYQTVNNLKCGPFVIKNKFGKTIQTSYYLNNKLHGKSTKYRNNGELLQVALYYQGKLHGYKRNYDRKSRLTMETTYHMGRRYGCQTTFSPVSGSVIKRQFYEANQKHGYYFETQQDYIIEGTYERNQQHGLWIKFFQKNGETVAQETFSFANGKKHGLWTFQGNNLNVVAENFKRNTQKFYFIGLFYQNEKHGIWKVYVDDQQILQRSYLFGKMNGTSFNYNHDENKYDIIPYVDNKIHGSLKSFENEKLQSTIQYQNGKREGTAETFYPNGQRKSQSTFLHDQLNGQKWNYDENGSLISIFNYKNNKLHGAFWKLEQELHCYGIFENDEQTDFEWKIYPHGVAYQFSSYKDGKIHGNSYTYAENGTLQSYEQYYKGIKHQKAYTYFPNGNIETIRPFYYGKLYGNRIQFFQNGKLSFSMSYYDDKRDGPFHQFSLDGKLLKKGFFKENKLQGWAKINEIYGVFVDNKAIVLSSDTQNDCIICYDKTKSKTNCNHYICFSCAKKLLMQPSSRTHCPYCRTSFSSKEIFSDKILFN